MKWMTMVWRQSIIVWGHPNRESIADCPEFVALVGTVWLRSPRRKRWLWGKHPGHLIPGCDWEVPYIPWQEVTCSFSQYNLGIQKYTIQFDSFFTTGLQPPDILTDFSWSYVFSAASFGRDETNIIPRVSWTRLWWGCSTSVEVSMHISETTQNKFLWEGVFGHVQITRHKDLKKTCRTRKRVLPISRG